MKPRQIITTHLFHSSALLRSIRLLLALLLVVTIFYHLSHDDDSTVAVVGLVWLVLLEVYMRFRIYRYSPSVALNKMNDKDIDAVCTQELLLVLCRYLTPAQRIQKLLEYPQIIFLLEKMGATKEDVQLVEYGMPQLLAVALEMAKSVKGEQLTTIDFFAAYVLSTEPKTRFLFQHEINAEQLQTIVRWARQEFSTEEFPPPIRVNFRGEGIGEALLNGWTLETQQFTSQFSYKHTPPLLIGREMQYKMMLEALLKQEQNNVLLVGDPGVGKESLVAYFTQESYKGCLAKTLNHKSVLQLMVGQLIASASNRSELELRLESIVQEVSHAHNIVLYIPDFENLLGSSSYGLDISGALLPHLQKGNLPIIASMSSGNYKAYMEHNPLQQVFTILPIEEPDRSVAQHMLIGRTRSIEQQLGVVFTYHAVVTALDLADSYDPDGRLPGSAVNLLQDTANTIVLSPTDHQYGKTRQKLVRKEDVIAQVNQRTHVNVGSPTSAEKERLLYLEEQLHERVINQTEAIKAMSESIRRVRSGLSASHRPISFLFLGPTGVGKSETAKALSEVYFGGEDKMIRLDMSEYADVDGERRLLGAAPGEGSERGELTEKMHDHPYSLVLLDEFEKASHKILDLFLQVLEDGRLTDNKGRTVNFSHSMIIATSNAGAEFIREKIVAGAHVDKAFQQELLEHLQQEHIFKPELLNRFDDVITFTPLGQNELAQIVKLLLKELIDKLAKEDIRLQFEQKVVEKIVKDGADVEFGARPLRRYIQDSVEDLIAKKKLSDEIQRGDRVVVGLGESGEITVK